MDTKSNIKNHKSETQKQTLSKEIGIFIYWVWEAGKGRGFMIKAKRKTNLTNEEVER